MNIQFRRDALADFLDSWLNGEWGHGDDLDADFADGVIGWFADATTDQMAAYDRLKEAAERVVDPAAMTQYNGMLCWECEHVIGGHDESCAIGELECRLRYIDAELPPPYCPGCNPGHGLVGTSQTRPCNVCGTSAPGQVVSNPEGEIGQKIIEVWNR